MSAPDPWSSPSRSRPTIAIYDRPPWWRRRRTWALALAALASIVAFALAVLWLG